MLNIIMWYLIGVLLSGAGIFAYEYFYFYDREIGLISTKEIVEDVLLSFLSWIMVLCIVISLALDIYMGWPSKGIDLYIKMKSREK